MRALFSSAFLGLVAMGAVVACSSSSSNGTPVPAPLDDAGDTDGGALDDADGTTPGTQCSSARATLLGPVAKVSTAAVSVLGEADGVKRIYIDASAGGAAAARTNPRVYVDLGAGTRVDVDDNAALTSLAWDLALRRAVLWTNSGDAGSSKGGGAVIARSFAAVTDAEAMAADLAPESFFEEDCTPKTDPLGAPLTTFSDWYDYDTSTNIPTPRADRTYIVRGGSGGLYKVGIESFDALADGGSRNNASTGFFLLAVHKVL